MESVVDAEDIPAEIIPVLVRQVIEQAAADYWQVACPGVELSQRGVQMLCLRAHLSDHQLAVEAHLTWEMLSAFAHHRPYDPPPSAQSLGRAKEIARRLVERVERYLVTG